METQAEFEARYSAQFPRAIFGQNTIALPCTCEDGGGPTHWAAINNNTEAIEMHLEHEECLADLRAMRDEVTP